jgi:hypothetical protein
MAVLIPLLVLLVAFLLCLYWVTSRRRRRAGYTNAGVRRQHR